MTGTYLFTSESVSEGHPDKMADQISDAILDAMLSQDPNSRVACETFIKTGMVLVGGEVRTSAKINFEQIIRDTIRHIGYTDSKMGFDADTCAVIHAIGEQSPDIAAGVDNQQQENQGAGDQGIMFGFATNETDELMPAPLAYSHRIMRSLAHMRHEGKLPWLRPDSKAQITFKYQDGKPIAIDTIVVSTQHAPEVSQADIKEAIIEEVIKKEIPEKYLNQNTKFHINPTGNFVIGGPMGDSGLTGRKIIVDTYGGMARHGGGAFSGKDPSKVDRSAAYAARHVAKNIVASGLAEKCEIQVSYAIGIAEPTSIMVDSFGTGAVSDEKLTDIVSEVFDLRPGVITKELELLTPRYLPTAAYGHFGRGEASFTWEQTNKVDVLKSMV